MRSPHATVNPRGYRPLSRAQRAVARAAGLPEPHALESVRVRGIVAGSGTVLVAVVGHGDAGGPEPWRVMTARDGNLILAWTEGERGAP